MTNRFEQGSPIVTPTSVKIVLGLIFCASTLAALFDRWFLYFFQLSLTKDILSLSWTGLQRCFLWQPFTYFFIEEALNGIDFSFLFNLAFKCYIISVAGAAICMRYKERLFIILTLGASLLGALCLLPYLMIDFPTLSVSGCTALFFSVIVFWSMMNNDGVIMLFFAFPISVKWLLSLLFIATFFMCLYHSDWATFSMVFFGSLWAYFWATIGYGLRTPFHWTWGWDDALERLGSSKVRRFKKK